MTTPTPFLVDSSPPLEPPKYGLLSHAEVITGAGKWQIAGIEYDTDSCADSGYVPGFCPVPTGEIAQNATATVEADGDPFTISYSITPGTTGPHDVAVSAPLGGVPVTLTLVRPGEGVPIAAAQRDPADPTGRTVQLSIDNTGTAADHEVLVTVQPGTTVPRRLAPGEWTVRDSYGACTASFSLPHAGGETPLVECTATGAGIRITNQPTSDYTLRYEIADVDGEQVSPPWVVEPGESHVQRLAAGTYQIRYTGADERGPEPPVVQEFTVPVAAPVNTTVPRIIPPGTSHDKPVETAPDWVRGCQPFTVYQRTECNTVGFEDPPGTAMRRLLLREELEVEKAFWDLCLKGRLGEAIKPFGETAVPLFRGLGTLEQQALWNYSGRPTFHLPRWLHPYFQSEYLLHQDDPFMRTFLDSRIVFGAGYEATNNPEPAYPEFWMFATGTVRAHRSQPFVNESVDPPTNRRIAIAERTYVLDSDCLLMAVKITVEGRE